MPFYRASFIVYASADGAVEADSEEEALQKFLEEAPGEPGLCYTCNRTLEVSCVGEVVKDSIEEIDEEEYEEIREKAY